MPRKGRERPSVRVVRQLFTYDPRTGKLRWRANRGGTARVGSLAGTMAPKNGLRVVIKGHPYQATHLIWVLMTGAWPPDEMQIDHRDGDHSNNRWDNLRLATCAQNNQNRSRQRHNRTGYIGVRQLGPRSFQAHIAANGERHWLGTFRTAFAAFLHYKDAAKRLHGEFART